jgi:hypothetical protein
MIRAFRIALLSMGVFLVACAVPTFVGCNTDEGTIEVPKDSMKPDAGTEGAKGGKGVPKAVGPGGKSVIP